MKQSEFREQWERLVDNLEQGKLTDKNMVARSKEGWRLFQHYSLARFEEAINACLGDPERRFFPTVGEIQGYLDDTQPPPATGGDPELEALLRDPEALRKRREENERWWRDEVLPMLERLGSDEE